MKILKLIVISILTLFAVGNVLQAADQEQGERLLGEMLVRQLWTNLKAGNMKVLDKTLATGFQSVHQDGARNREQEMEILKGLNLGSYALSNLKVTRNGPVIVATYYASGEETIDGKRLSRTPAPRLSVFLKTESGWQWIAHANFKPLK